MAYTKTNWQTGDIVSSERLNKIENAIANADKITEVNEEEFMPTRSMQDNTAFRLDKTYNEIYNADFATIKSAEVYDEDNFHIYYGFCPGMGFDTEALQDSDKYYVFLHNFNTVFEYHAPGANDTLVRNPNGTNE